MNQGGHIPDPGEGQSVDDKRLTTKREKARSPGLENIVHRSDIGSPVIFLRGYQHRQKHQEL